MKTKIGKYDAATRTVSATFTEGNVVHTRSVNACLDSSGDYLAAETKDRVAEVARGVAVKIGLGVIVNPPEVEAEPAADAVPTA